MRKPRTEFERIALKKFEAIVKEVIDEYDPIGVMEHAPENHYEIEIKEIALKIAYAPSVERIQKIIYVVMSYWFGVDEGGTLDECRVPAEKIAERIGLKK